MILWNTNKINVWADNKSQIKQQIPKQTEPNQLEIMPRNEYVNRTVRECVCACGNIYAFL